ncbi:MAG: VOC family protein [Actinomycetaceae bacterium]|nr:VOC family protein [Actinomycetaceae bacterium]
MGAEPKGVDNVFIQVADLQAAQAWYEETAGLVTKFATEAMAVMQVGDDVARVVLVLVDDVERSANVWFEVDDAAALAREFGVEPCDISTGRTVTIEDPWGTAIGFTDYVYRPDLAR